VVVKDDLLDAHPDLARDLLEAFIEAKRLYMDRLGDPLLLRVKEIIGDPLPYGVEDNRQMLEALVQYATEQRIIRRSFALDELFVS
jgi:4,5-dihydroxyphthalate decarboxylase